MILEYKSFSEIVYDAKTIKTYYLGLLSSFSMYEIKQRNDKLREIKKEIYSLKMDFWRIDKIWEYINDDINYNDLFMLRNL